MINNRADRFENVKSLSDLLAVRRGLRTAHAPRLTGRPGSQSHDASAQSLLVPHDKSRAAEVDYS